MHRMRRALSCGLALTLGWLSGTAQPEDAIVERWLKIPMRDGVFLDAEVYRYTDSDQKAYPVTVVSTIYHLDFHRDRLIPGMMEGGYIYVGVHMRDGSSRQANLELGGYASAYQATDDAYDIVEWVTRQRWCDGRVGFRGGSGNGVGASAALWSNHPNLVAVSVSHTSSNFHDYWMYENGVKRDTFGLAGNRGVNTTARIQIKPDTVRTDKREWMEWIGRRARESTVAYFESGGLYDIFEQACLDNFSVLAARGRAYVILEPRWHGTAVAWENLTYNIYANRPAFPASYNAYMAGTAAGGNSVLHYSVIGKSGNTYRSTPAFPLDTTPVPLYLRADGSLAFTPPSGGGSLAYLYDPNDPCPPAGGNPYLDGTNYGPRDQRPVSGRPDVLVFETEPLASAMEFTGEIEVVLYFETDVEDTQFVVKLVDVDPATGYEALLRDGVCMARYQAGFGGDPAALPRLQPGQVYRLNFKMWAGSAIVAAGHRLAVHVTSSAAKKELEERRHYYAVHPNRFDPVASLAGAPVANQRIHASPAHPSHVVLPVTRWQADSPQIAVSGGGRPIRLRAPRPGHGDHAWFGGVETATGTRERSFTVRNANATHALHLTGTPRVALGGPQAGDFTVSAEPPASIAGGTEAAFTLRFEPSAGGLRTATVRIESDDPFAPAWEFAVAGFGAPPGLPAIAVYGQDSAELQHGDNAPDWDKWTDFDEVRKHREKRRTFFIENRGVAPLSVSGVTAAGNPAFRVASGMVGMIGAGDRAAFEVAFAPVAAGAHTATVTVQSDDPASPTFAFAVSGRARNHAPILNPDHALPDVVIPTGLAREWTIPRDTVFYEPDNDPLLYTATLESGAPLPDWLSLNPVTGVFTALAGAGDAGSHRLRVRATEDAAEGGFVEAAFTLQVVPRFSDWAMLNGLAPDPRADSTGSGVPNLLLFAFGMDPLRVDRSLLPRLEPGAPGAAGQGFSLCFRDPGLADLSVWTSEDLRVWQELDSAAAGFSHSDALDGVPWMRLPLPVANPPPANLFLRVRAAERLP